MKSKSESDLIRIHEHHLFTVHECNKECTAKTKKTCKEKDKVVFPRMPIPIKFLHLFYKKEELHSDIHHFLHFMLRCLVKNHAETVVESMGNLVDMHSEKRRGLGIEDVGRETFIDWNGPPVHLCENLGTKTLDRIFKGSKWHFITVANKSDSEVTNRLKNEKSRIPFF